MDCETRVLDEELKDLTGITDEGLKNQIINSKSKKIKQTIESLKELKKSIEKLPVEDQRKLIQKYAKDMKYISKAEVQNILNIERNINDAVGIFNRKEFKGKPHLARREYLRQVEDEVALRKDDYLGAFITNLKKNDLLEYFAKDENGILIHKELAAMVDGQEPVSVTGDVKAFKSALEVRKLTNYIYNDALDSGIPILKIQNYAGPQNYDTDKVVLDDNFTKNMVTWLDRNHPSYAGQTEEDLFKMVEDIKEKITFGEITPDVLTSEDFKTPKFLLQKMLKPRSLHLKPEFVAEAYSKYGAKSFAVNIEGYATSMARRSALVSKFGGDLDQGYNSISETMYALADAKGKKKLAEGSRAAHDIYRYMTDWKFTGEGTSKVAMIGKEMRALTAATTLNYGTTLASMMSDPIIGPMWAKSRMGVDFFKAQKDFVTNYIKALNPEKRAKMARLLGRVLETDLEEYKSRLELEPKVKPGFISKYTDKVMSLTGMKHQFAISKLVQNYIAAAELAEFKNLEFDNLNPYVKQTLSDVGITADEWNILRQNTVDDEGIDIISSEHIKTLAPSLGDVKAQALSKKVSRFYRKLDRGVVAPGAEVQSSIAATPVDTVGGQVWRFVQMYKGFAMTMGHTVADINRFNPEDLAIKIGEKEIYKGHYKNTAQVVLGLTVGGYITTMLKDIAQGKEPRDPTDPDVILKAFVNSGAVGPYADFILSDATIYGASPEAVIAGPVLGKAGDAVQMFQKEVKDFYNGTNKVEAMDWFNYAFNNVPLANSPGVKPILDYLLLNDIRNHMDLTYNIRKVKRMKEQSNIFGNQRDFIFDPVNDTLGLFK